jgi:hypothetical protein
MMMIDGIAGMQGRGGAGAFMAWATAGLPWGGVANECCTFCEASL